MATSPAMNKDYRGFVLCWYQEHLLLLHCTRKPRKGPHWQLPGGHVDKEDGTDLRQAAVVGAARELFEETGIDVRECLDRIKPAVVRDTASNDNGALSNEYKSRLFYNLHLTDLDFPSSGHTAANGLFPTKVHLKLSHEHSGFTLEGDIVRATTMLKLHSGGKVSEALKRHFLRLHPELVFDTDNDNRALQIPPPKQPESKGCCFSPFR